MKRRICFVTGTRAEFGLLRTVLEDVRNAHDLELQLIVTGAHLSETLGLTYGEIQAAGFEADAKVDMLLDTDSAIGVTKSMALGLAGMAEAYAKLSPDIVVVLGDRYEILAAASAALVMGIPLAHIHGGERTEAAIDDAIRHSVTKMSHLHFVAAEEYRRRVIQLGEQPDRVFNVGGLGVDSIHRMDLMDRESLEASLEFRLGVRNLLVTFHPVTLECEYGIAEMEELLAALGELDDTHLIFTMPNADPGHSKLASMVEDFVDSRPNARAYQSLGHRRYLSTLKQMDGVVGNSSSGLTEAPTLRVGTVNIGDRQLGRLQANSVINCKPLRDEIREAIRRLYLPEFRRLLAVTQSPYGNGGASAEIVRILREHPLDTILKKRFHDLRPAASEMAGIDGHVSQ